MTNENSEILQMLLSEDDDDVHLALILIMEGKVKCTLEEMNTFIYSNPRFKYESELYLEVVRWTNSIHGKAFNHLRELADKSQELFTNQ